MVATTATAAEAELTALLIRHFHEHQQQAVAVVNDDTVVVGVVQKDHHHAVEAVARAQEIMSQVAEFKTRYALENLRTNDNDNDKDDHDNDNDNNNDEPSWDDIMAQTLTRFLDCAMANTDTDVKESGSNSSSSSSSSSSSMAAVDAILSLVAAVAAHGCFQKQKKQKNQPKKQKQAHTAHAQLVGVVVMQAVLQRTVEFSTVLLERVRCAACRGLGYIVQNLQQQGGYNTANSTTTTLAGLLDTASQALVPRFIDKSQAVRLAAITAAGCFFTSSSAGNNHTMDDPDLRTALTWALQHDASVVNRRAALQCLPVTVQTMPVLLSRLRDVKPKIRRTVLHILQNMSNSCHYNFLTLLDASQCAGIVQAGLSDRDEEVQNETVQLICTTWMKTAKFNPITILQHLNVLEHEEACEKVIQVLLDADEETVLAEHLSDPEIRAYWQGIETATTSPVSSSPVSTSSSPPLLLDVHLVFFARVRCQYVQDIHQTAKNVTSTRQTEAILQKVLPDVPVLCEIFQLHSAALISGVVAATTGGQSDDDDDIMDDTHSIGRRRSSAVASSMTTREQEKHQDALTLTCLQLLQMACMTPWSEMEEGARLHLKQTMTTMLGSILTPDDLVEGCLVSLQAIHGNETDFCTSVADIVHQLQRDEQVIMASSSGSKSSSDDENDNDGLNDNRLLRILSILSILLEKVSLQVAVTCTAMLTDFASNIIVPAITTTSGETNELVREAAVSCLGKLGLFTCESMVVRDFKPLLLNIVANEDETLEIRAQAMLALCDWSIFFSDALGPCPVSVADTANDDTNKSSTAVPLVAFPDLIFELMAHEELGMACVAAEVACKLLILDKICESSWLARLVTLFFDVRLNDDDEVMEDDSNDHSGHVDATTVAAASEVGSPIRLQQLLSLFFPAYSHKSEQNRHALAGAISMILDTLLAWHSQKKKRGAKAPVSVSKVLDYVVDTVHAADQTVQENLATKHMETTGGKEATAASQYSTPVLIAAIQMASFLSKEHANCKVLFLRTICKHLGLVATKNLQEAVEREKDRDLSVLMDLMQNLDMEITDAACLKSLEPLNDVLDTIELDDDDASKVVVDDEDEKQEEEEDAGHGDDDEDEAKSIVDALQTMAITPPPTVLDKENRSKDTRRVASMSSIGGGKRGGGSDRQRRQRCSNSSEGVLGNL